MANNAFVGLLQRTVGTVAPWFMRRFNVGAFLESVVFSLDVGLETLNQALSLTRPFQADTSFLTTLAFDRGILLYQAEPVSSQRTRLAMWHQLHRQRGTQQGELRNLQAYFLPGPLPLLRAVHQAGDGSSATWHELTPEGVYSWYRAVPSNWNWDDQPEKWSRFWVIVYTDTLCPAQPAQWNDAAAQTWDGGSLWDGTFTSAQISAMVQAVTSWSAAHEQFSGLIFATDPLSFDPTDAIVVNPDGTSNLPDGLWGYSVDPVTGDPTRLSTAVFPYLRSA